MYYSQIWIGLRPYAIVCKNLFSDWKLNLFWTAFLCKQNGVVRVYLWRREAVTARGNDGDGDGSEKQRRRREGEAATATVTGVRSSDGKGREKQRRWRESATVPATERQEWESVRELDWDWSFWIFLENKFESFLCLVFLCCVKFELRFSLCVLCACFWVDGLHVLRINRV